ncbi:hypothetical protein JAAARDRAFT_485601 [Jaapia argillacea MUCL 33604]|uniref:Uncharacterized protein n=1 Tax=Jaapia argillacea MUCL 33604 TaxID=933084 RepID=A0A067PPH9_9AGAM|nr:hypothetical protein JAAARDRAFT_485601 [Jaapia argillacea MUCL 33604]
MKGRWWSTKTILLFTSSRHRELLPSPRGEALRTCEKNTTPSPNSFSVVFLWSYSLHAHAHSRIETQKPSRIRNVELNMPTTQPASHPPHDVILNYPS